jgi:hypothetical protein
MKKKLKELRAKKTRLEGEAAAKLKLITPETKREDATRIEGEHATLTTQIQEVAAEITALEQKRSTRRDRRREALAILTRAGDEDGEDDDDDDGEDGDRADDDGDDDDDDADATDADKKRKRKKEARAMRALLASAGLGGAQGALVLRALLAGATDGENVLTRAQIAELVVIDNQSRGLGIDLNLADAMQRNETPDAMRKRLFVALADKSKKGGGPLSNANGGGLEVTRDENEGRSAAMEIALITRLLQSRGQGLSIEYKPKNILEAARVEKHKEQARQYLGMGFVEIAAHCIGYRSERLRVINAGTAIEILNRAFESTSDFPNIFENVLNKSLLARYELHMPTYRELAIERQFNDFRPHPQIRAGEFPQLQPLTETGELKYGTTADSGEVVAVVPYGVVFTISRQMLVNDDLGAIDQILGSAGDAVLIFENNTFFVMFNGNPVLKQDSLAVFTAGAITLPPAAAVGHNNLFTGGGIGGAPSISTIGSAREALRQMKSISGNFLNVPPRIIFTGPAQETAADQMVAAITPTLTTSVNPFSGRLRSVSDANITDGSWYLLCEPGRVPCFIYGFLNGASGPRVRTYEPFGVQGVKISLEHDFGCGAIDYRGIAKNAGS